MTGQIDKLLEHIQHSVVAASLRAVEGSRSVHSVDGIVSHVGLVIDHESHDAVVPSCVPTDRILLSDN